MSEIFRALKFILVTRISLGVLILFLTLGIVEAILLLSAPQIPKQYYYYLGLALISLSLFLGAYRGITVSIADATYYLLAVIHRKNLAFGYYFGEILLQLEYLVFPAGILYPATGITTLAYILYSLTGINLAVIFSKLHKYVRVIIAIPLVVILWITQSPLIPAISLLTFFATFFISIRKLENLQISALEIREKVNKLYKPIEKTKRFVKGNLAILYANLSLEKTVVATVFNLIFFLFFSLLYALFSAPTPTFILLYMAIFLAVISTTSALADERLWTLLEEEKVRFAIITVGIFSLINISIPLVAILLAFHQYALIPLAFEVPLVSIIMTYLHGFWKNLYQFTGELEEYREFKSVSKSLLLFIAASIFSLPAFLMDLPLLSLLVKLAFSIIFNLTLLAIALYLIRAKTSKLISKLSESGWV